MAAVVVSALVSGGVSGGVVALTRDDRLELATPTPLRTGGLVRPPSAAAPAGAGTNSIREVLRAVEPAVVAIRTQAYRPGGGASPTGAGTGIILTADGEVLTNAHVVVGATSIKVTLSGETVAREADLVGSDEDNDLALLKIRGAKDLPVAQLGDSDAINVGDDVVAIGNALALAGGPSVTTGIVSAKNRALEGDETSLAGLIQTDAAINPGNSGGPLVDSAGRVVGINTAVIQGTGQALAQNVGFAIAVNRAKPIIERIRSGDPAVASTTFIGVSLETLTPEIRQRFGFRPEDGVIVSEVTPGSPAENAGLRVGDVIVGFGGKDVKTAEDLADAIRGRKPGDTVDVRYFRGDQELEAPVRLGSRGARPPR